MVQQGAVFPPLPSVTRGRSCKIDCTDGDELTLVYCNGSNVLIRNVSSNESILFDGHKSSVLVAKISACQTLVASGDSQGNLLIWDVERASGKRQGNATILNQKLWPGPINDVAWSNDGKFLFVVGSDSILWNVEKQTSAGKVKIHTRPINSVCWRADTKEACTGSDDFSVALFAGSPIGFQKSLNDHSNFVQQVAFSPSGQRLASVGSDRKIVVHNFDAKSGIECHATKLEASHDGSIFGVTWIDEDKFVTCSADKLIKFWSLTDGKICLEAQLTLENQILGLAMNQRTKKCSFVSLQPSLTIVDCNTRKIEYSIHGHATAVTQLFSQQRHTYSVDKEGWIYEDTSKRVMQLEENSFVCMHDSSIASLTYGKLVLLSKGENVWSTESVNAVCNFQSKLWYTSKSKLQCINFETIKEEASHSVKDEITLMACNDEKIFAYAQKQASIFVFDVKNGLEYTHSLKYIATCISISPDRSHLAVGCQTGLIQIFAIEQDKLVPVIDYEWSAHCAIVNQILWISSSRLLSCSLDKCIIQWSMDDKFKWKIQRGAHSGSVNCLCRHFEKENIFLTGGADGCIKEWKLEH